MVHLQYLAVQRARLIVHVRFSDQSCSKLLLQTAIISSLLVKEHFTQPLVLSNTTLRAAHNQSVQRKSCSILMCHWLLMQDMQAESAGLKIQLNTKQDMNRELCERIDTLEADLIDETNRALSAEDEADCLEAELADAIAKADSSLLKFKVGTQFSCCLLAYGDKGLGM